MGQEALIQLVKKGVLQILSPLKSIASAGFEPANLWYTGKH
jgi:hypothetical protein